MKSTKRIITWIIFSLIVQIIGFVYIDKIYLSTNTSVRFKKVEKKENDTKKDVEVPIPAGAEHVALSFDGKYVAYNIDGQLKVINTKDGKEKKVSFDEGVDISFYKWLPDRNRILIGEKHNSNNSSGLKLSYYDVDREESGKIKDLTWADENSEVEDIQYSVFTNVIYIKVSRSGGRSSFYWIDINKQLRNLYLKSDFVGEIAILHNEDKLIYEDKTYNRVYATGMENSIKIKDVDNPKLLGVDDDDNVYIGALEDNKISKIYYGKVETPTSEWKVMPLVQPANSEDIFILDGGKIVINDNLKGMVKEIATGKEYSYSGIFLQVYDNGVASIKDGKLIKTLFK
ncbi:hypothetical protein [uncultured Clostridium sp.]|uniref:hypothetical protein n=1 Tax=uncultured Clostridium sp. TaxID=59620 RepID=UPI0028EB49E4|nr:hypothetical protein [uncultured Clostridium sp.]